LQSRLQAIRILDIQKYRRLKTGLPYLVCAQFHPRVRKKENFIYTERFIIDIDHLSEFDIDMASLKHKLMKDPRVELLFTSPGGDGLKVFFRFTERVNDTGYYAMFYKSFCMRFSEQYGLNGAVDSKTNDVSRCCFVSYDPEAFFNPDPEKIDAATYLPAEGANDLDFFTKSIDQQEKENYAIRKETGITPGDVAPLTDDILAAIKARVGMRVAKKPEKSYEQPEELNQLMAEIMEQVSQVGASVISSTPISYGRKVRIGAGNYWAEINLFFGQRGVSIVGTTKTGSNKELCNSIVQLLKNHFNV